MAITGDFLTMKIGSTPVNVVGVQKWRAADAVERLNGQTALDAGYSHPDSGTKSLKVQAHLVIDITTGSLTPIAGGTLITQLKLYSHIDAPTPIYTLPKARVLSCSPGGEMGGTFDCDLDIENVGPFTLTDPSAPV